MNCEKFEELLSAGFEGELSSEEKRAMNLHMVSCPSCASLHAAMREMLGTLDGFPEIEPSPALLSRLHAIPRRRRIFRPAFDFLLRPALQPVYAAFTVLFVALSFVLFHPEGRGIQKSLNRQLHLGFSQVEKLYSEAGSVRDDIVVFTNTFLDSFKTINPLKGKEE